MCSFNISYKLIYKESIFLKPAQKKSLFLNVILSIWLGNIDVSKWLKFQGLPYISHTVLICLEMGNF